MFDPPEGYSDNNDYDDYGNDGHEGSSIYYDGHEPYEA